MGNRIREFRGYNTWQKKWFYGSYVDGHIVNGVIESNNEYITIENWVPVDKKSVGQNTGLKDIDGKELYEGDIVNVYDNYSGRYFGGVIEYKDGSYCIVNDVSSNYRLVDYLIKLAKTGNRD